MVVVIVVSLLAAGRAAAQSASAQAEAAFRQGKALMANGEYAEACKAFDASQKLEPTVPTQINQAYCREKNDQLATAWSIFLDAERQTRDARNRTTKKLHDSAAERARKLAARVSKLTISVSADSQVVGLEILRDKEPLDAAVWNVGLPVDGGTYTVTARAPGATEWSTSVTLATEGDTKTVDIPKLRVLTPPPATDKVEPPAVAATKPVSPSDHPPLSAQPPIPAQPPTPAHPSSPAHPSKALPLAFGIGAVALGGGAIGFELWARSTYNDAKAEMKSQSRRDSLYTSSNTKRYVAEGMAFASITAAGTAVWLYLHGRNQEPTSAVARIRHLVITPTGVAFVNSF